VFLEEERLRSRTSERAREDVGRGGAMAMAMAMARGAERSAKEKRNSE